MATRGFLRLERDHELRKRVLVRLGPYNLLATQAQTAYGKALDELATLCDLQRKIVEDMA